MTVEEDYSYYVYGWFNKNWCDYFYVGKGKNGRMKSTQSRSKRFLKIIDEFDCEPIILLDNLSEEEALESEKSIKESFIYNLGCPIIDGENVSSAYAQRKGIEKAKKQGKYKGRKRIEADDIFDVHYMNYLSGVISTKTELAKKLGVSRPTLYRMIGELND